MAKRKTKRIYQNKMWEAARLYRKETDKCTKLRAYFMAILARACGLEALLRIFIFVENRRPKDRCYNLNAVIDRAFKRHWTPHAALRCWKNEQPGPLKTRVHEIREERASFPGPENASICEGRLEGRGVLIDAQKKRCKGVG
jgi:hypothetical protein